MQRIPLKRIHFRIEIERLPVLTLYATYIVAILCLSFVGWYTYRNVYIPYMSDVIPEELLTQKQDKLNVKDFNDVRAKLEAKQKGSPSTTIIDPFQAR
jgi:hypothetical protein